MLVHGNYLCLSGDTVEECFDVIDESLANVVGELLCIFEEDHVVKSEVINWFSFVVRDDLGWEGVYSLKAIGHFDANPTYEEGFPIMVQYDWSTNQWVTWFMDGVFSEILNGSWKIWCTR